MKSISLALPRSILTISMLLLLSGLFSCQKEKSLENSGDPGVSGGTASYALVPDGSKCSDALVSGNFVKGTALATDARITVTVNVTKVGTWSIKTSKANGFEFVGAGEFTSTGLQSIILYGLGTPVDATTNDFTIAIGSSRCAVPVTVTNQSTGTAQIYFKATINGVNYYQEVTDNNDYMVGTLLSGTDDVWIASVIAHNDDPAPAGSISMSVEKAVMHGYTTATDAAFKAFFPVGDHPYAPPAASPYANGDGIIIGFGDPTGQGWSSNHPTKGQAGSTFKIISVEEGFDLVGTYYVKLKMQFSCKLYNENTGAEVQLTNGEMVSYFGKI